MNRLFGLLLGVFLAVAQMASAHMGADLVRVHYAGGFFGWNGGLDWVEQGDNGTKFSFVEVGRDSDLVMLFDASRDIYVTFDTVNWVVMYAEGDGDFTKLYDVTGMDVER